jgi:hypothetical protein
MKDEKKKMRFQVLLSAFSLTVLSLRLYYYVTFDILVFNLRYLCVVAIDGLNGKQRATACSSTSQSLCLFFVGWDLRHQVLRPFPAYCTAPDDR